MYGRYKHNILVLVCMMLTYGAFTQAIYLDAKVAKAKREEQVRLNKMIAATFALPIADSTVMQYQSAFWAMMYVEQKPASALPKIKMALANFSKYDNTFQNALLEVVYAQYPKELGKEIFNLINDSLISAKQFAQCAEYLLKNNINKSKVFVLVQKRIQTAFEKLEKKSLIYYNAIFSAQPYSYQKKEPVHEYNKEVIKLLLNNEYLADKTLVISLQNKNRDYPGIAVIRKANGEILKFKDSIFYVQQLTRSITNLPYYISNGNTPQGIFRIDGFGVSTNTHIGTTENFQLCMPFECAVKDFFDEVVTDTIWTDAIVNRILPKQMNADYAFLLESTIAGKLGRYEIIAHGSTVNTDYYKTKSYKGFTPTMGCLQAKELWNYTTGERVYSDQQKLIDAYKSTRAVKGYLVVLDIIDAQRPVTIVDLKPLIK
jgi:hypothetical protein